MAKNLVRSIALDTIGLIPCIVRCSSVEGSVSVSCWNRLVSAHRTNVLHIKKELIRQNVRDAYDKLELKERNMESVVIRPGGSGKEWVVRAGNGVGCAPTKNVARMVAIARACLDPEFTGYAPLHILGTAQDMKLTAFGPPRVPDNHLDKMLTVGIGPEEVVETHLDPTVRANLGSLASAVLESYGRDTVKSVSIDCKDRKTFQVRICHEETLTFPSE